MPLYEFNCMAHGRFERMQSMSAGIPKCPHGCSAKLVTKMVSRASIVTNNKTKFIDKKTADLARQFGETEFNDKYDKSRISMAGSGTTKDKWLRGETFGLASEVTMGVDGLVKDASKVASVVGELGASSDGNIAAVIGHAAGMDAVKATNIIADDHGKTKLPEAA